MRSGKVSLSALSHTGPVKFISSIQCSLTFAMQPLSDDSGLWWDQIFYGFFLMILINYRCGQNFYLNRKLWEITPPLSDECLIVFHSV